MSEVLFPLWGPLGVRVRMDTRALEELVARVQGAVQAPQGLLEEIGRIVRASYGKNFAEGGRPAWRPLAESTVRQRSRMLAARAIPKHTPAGKIPPRLQQRDPVTGGMGFSARTILIRSGTLRDSWVQKGARGNVSEVTADGAFFGSQLTIERTVTPEQVRPYHLLTKKAQRELRRRGRASARVPLAAFHEAGTSKMPARPVGVIQDEDLEAIGARARTWVLERMSGT